MMIIAGIRVASFQESVNDRDDRLAPDDGEQPLLAADEEAIERWFFDTMGYLIVKQVMDRGETLDVSSFVRV